MSSPDSTDESEQGGAREITVPMRLYKTVTVFSTLFAMAGVVAGFVLLDSATNRATAELSEINVALALAGLAAILFGATVYAFATRFQTAEMGNAKDDDDELSDNG
jgi:zinc transporter ZupT